MPETEQQRLLRLKREAAMALQQMNGPPSFPWLQPDYQPPGQIIGPDNQPVMPSAVASTEELNRSMPAPAPPPPDPQADSTARMLEMMKTIPPLPSQASAAPPAQDKFQSALDNWGPGGLSLIKALPKETQAEDQPALPQAGKPHPVVNEDADREKKLNRLEMLKGIAEGLGKIGNFTSVGDVYLGRNPHNQPFEAEYLRKKIADIEDEIPDDLRKSMEDRVGLQIPKEVGFSRLKTFLPTIGGIMESQHRAEQQTATRDRLDMGKASAEFQRIVQARNNGLMNARLARDAIESGTQTGIQALKTLLQKAAGDTGNISQSEQQQYGHRVQFADRVQDWLTELTQGRLTNGRKEDVLRLIGTYEKENDKFLNDMRDTYANRWSYIMGKDPQELKNKLFMMPGIGNQKMAQASKPASGAGGTTPFKTPDGTNYNIPVGQEKEFLKDHPDAVPSSE